MGNSTSSSGRGQHEETVDYGYLHPHGIYTGPRDWNQNIATQLIIDRKLAPFYRPLEDYDESWDDDQILAARKEFQDPEATNNDSTPKPDPSNPIPIRPSHANKRPQSLRETYRVPEATVYRDAVECPICFLYYPPNINRSRCCDQAICTECFVQIKRTEPTTTHLVSEPAACPYCVQDNFGVIYTPPQWRSGIGSEGSGFPLYPIPSRSSSFQSSELGSVNSTFKQRRKSFSPDSSDVVTIDRIRPDWEAKLAAVRAAVARRANRRIVMRQVGDRLIPVGVTSGRIHPLAPETVGTGEQGENTDGSGESRSSRRSRRRQQQQQDLNQLLGSMGLGGQDLEELMVMEAMRLSLLEHEEQQRRESQNKNTPPPPSEGNQGSEPILVPNPRSTGPDVPSRSSDSSSVRLGTPASTAASPGNSQRHFTPDLHLHQPSPFGQTSLAPPLGLIVPDSALLGFSESEQWQRPGNERGRATPSTVSRSRNSSPGIPSRPRTPLSESTHTNPPTTALNEPHPTVLNEETLRPNTDPLAASPPIS